MPALRSATIAALGATCMYFWDPNSGRRRRARTRDALDHAVHQSLRGLDVASRDLAHRAHGAGARVRGITAARPDDDVLVERVRAELGRWCSHPHAITVRCNEGKLELRGPILAHEAARVLAHARGVSGVVSVEDNLERHATTDVPVLTGGSLRPLRRPFMPTYWPPSTRLMATCGGIFALACGAIRGGVIGTLTGIGGGLTALRAITNIELGSLFGVGQRRRGVTVTKTITIQAPPSEVFAQFTAFETFPRFMRRVSEVKRVDENVYHFRVRGPGGVSFEWDGVVVRRVPDEYVAWTSGESTIIRHCGSAAFERAPNGTRVTIRMTYEPPIGFVGHEIARLIGADPKRELDEDMLRLKSLIEEGQATGREGTVTRSQLEAARPS